MMVEGIGSKSVVGSSRTTITIGPLSHFFEEDAGKFLNFIVPLPFVVRMDAKKD